MIGQREERAVSAVIGAVLLLGILVTALALYQVTTVPEQNRAVEFNHNERVTSDLLAVRNSLDNAVRSGTGESVSVTLGTQYNTRVVAINPPNPSGSITTETPPEEIQIDTESDSVSFETTFIHYEPRYNEYRNAPTGVIEHSLLYNRFSNANVVAGEQVVFGSSQIVIPVVEGAFSRSMTGTTTITTETLGEPKRLETNDTEITITLPTDAPETWNDSLESFDPTVEDETVSVTVDSDEYDVIVARIGVGDGTGANAGTLDDSSLWSPVSTGETGDTTAEQAAGPDVTAHTVEPADPDAGEETTIDASFSNIGSADDERGGVPIVEAEWALTDDDGTELERGSLTNGDTSELEWENVTATFDAPDDDGEYTVTVRAMDARGVWTPIADSERSAQTITVESEDEDEEEDPSGLEFVEGNEEVDASSIQFDVENVDDGELTVTAGGVNTPLADTYDRGTGANNVEIEFRKDSGDEGLARNSELDADGTVYDFDEGPGDPATLEEGERATVDIGEFDGDPFDPSTVEHTTDPSETDLEVIFEIDGETRTFYFTVEQAA